MPFLRLYSGTHLQKQWPLLTDRLTIGRASDNDIVLQNPSISKYHAVIEKEGNAFVLVDNRSANGVFIKGQRIERQTLAFWDEIQIHPYKLVYMALAKLPGEEEGLEAHEAGKIQKDATMMVNKDEIVRLLDQMKQQKSNVVYLIREGAADRLVLDTSTFTLGRARDSDIRCGGWFSPALAAKIERRLDGHYLVPAKRGRVMVNGLAIHDAVRLAENDRLNVQGVALRYYIRPL
ncbi:FHA domain-containing protein [Thiocystis violascens]|uniref:FHA domain-containing protein n=1 Tax=Thiocystis violascens (strain ATCC 17096 / DSM 198 / 6111) TaxID=765911 RepID=I3YCK0_THIV6|nr:FHA domain-containing protein [Thiocystis violascens]AFL74718.1 FHA domain-containing protein [Thiocystis violascens DSM 198]